MPMFPTERKYNTVGSECKLAKIYYIQKEKK